MSEEEAEARGASEPSESPAAPGTGGAEREPRDGMDLVLDVPLRLSVQVGRARMLVREVLQLTKGSVIELDRGAGEPADLYVNGRLVGRGDLMVVEDRLAIKLVEVGSAGLPVREG